MEAGVDVLHVVPAYYPVQGGIETLIRQASLDLLVRHRLRSAVLVPRRETDEWGAFELEGTAVIPVEVPKPVAGQDMSSPDRFATVTRTFGSVRRAITAARPRIVHIHANSEVSLPAYNVSRSSGIPVIMHVHGEVSADSSPAFLKQLRENPVVVAVSDPVAASIARHAGRRDEVVVVPNGVGSVPDSVLLVEPDEDGPPVMLMVGRLEEAKGFDAALRAAAGVRPSPMIVIIGEGEQRRELEAVARETGLSGRVRFLGRQEHSETLRWMRRSRLVVVPSRHTEGFSLVAAESGLCGRPVVVTDVGGLPVTVRHGETGTVVPVGDDVALASAIQSYVLDPALARRHGEAATRWITAQFGLTRFGDDLACIYGRIGSAE